MRLGKKSSPDKTERVIRDLVRRIDRLEYLVRGAGVALQELGESVPMLAAALEEIQQTLLVDEVEGELEGED
jgi:hypothetical protein